MYEGQERDTREKQARGIHEVQARDAHEEQERGMQEIYHTQTYICTNTH